MKQGLMERGFRSLSFIFWPGRWQLTGECDFRGGLPCTLYINLVLSLTCHFRVCVGTSVSPSFSLRRRFTVFQKLPLSSTLLRGLEWGEADFNTPISQTGYRSSEKRSDSPKVTQPAGEPWSQRSFPQRAVSTLDLEKSIVILTIDLGVEGVEKVVIKQRLQQLHLVENRRGTP